MGEPTVSAVTSALVTDTERVGFVLNDDRLRRAARQSTTEKMQIPCEESMQMDTSFKPGDVVQLNSGGPKMTVEAVQSDRTLRCVWFHEDGNQDHGVFAQVALRSAKTKN